MMLEIRADFLVDYYDYYHKTINFPVQRMLQRKTTKQNHKKVFFVAAAASVSAYATACIGMHHQHHNFLLKIFFSAFFRVHARYLLPACDAAGVKSKTKRMLEKSYSER